MRTEKHVHKYLRIKYKTGHTIFRCMLEDCPHWIREELVLKRKCICWRCGNPFTMHRTDLKKPHCENCTKRKDKNGESLSPEEAKEIKKKKKLKKKSDDDWNAVQKMYEQISRESPKKEGNSN